LEVLNLPDDDEDDGIVDGEDQDGQGDNQAEPGGKETLQQLLDFFIQFDCFSSIRSIIPSCCDVLLSGTTPNRFSSS